MKTEAKVAIGGLLVIAVGTGIYLATRDAEASTSSYVPIIKPAPDKPSVVVPPVVLPPVIPVVPVVQHGIPLYTSASIGWVYAAPSHGTSFVPGGIQPRSISDIFFYNFKRVGWERYSDNVDYWNNWIKSQVKVYKTSQVVDGYLRPYPPNYTPSESEQAYVIGVGNVYYHKFYDGWIYEFDPGQ